MHLLPSWLCAGGAGGAGSGCSSSSSARTRTNQCQRGGFQLPGPKIRSAPKKGARSSLNGGRLAAQTFSVGEPPAHERRGAGGIGRAESSTDFLQGLAGHVGCLLLSVDLWSCSALKKCLLSVRGEGPSGTW